MKDGGGGTDHGQPAAPAERTYGHGKAMGTVARERDPHWTQIFVGGKVGRYLYYEGESHLGVGRCSQRNQEHWPQQA